jgi:hypothetical protein
VRALEPPATPQTDTAYCGVCAAPTRAGKPWCVEHLAASPYVHELQRRITARYAPTSTELARDVEACLSPDPRHALTVWHLSTMLEEEAHAIRQALARLGRRVTWCRTSGDHQGYYLR